MIIKSTDEAIEYLADQIVKKALIATEKNFARDFIKPEIIKTLKKELERVGCWYTDGEYIELDPAFNDDWPLPVFKLRADNDN